MENETNKRMMESVGAVDYLTSIITTNEVNVADEALTILYHLKLSQTGLKSIFGKSTDFVEALTRVMQRSASDEDQISLQATKATLKLLINVCPWGRNRIKAAEAGVLSVLIDTLLDTTEKRVSEMVIVALHQLSQIESKVEGIIET
ncbi:E3 ubiquitin protein ligase PUB23-like protein [Tanacetum coccineum]